MKTFLLILTLAFGLYPEAGKVIDVCPEKDIVLVTTSTGNLYEFYGAEDWETDDYCMLLMHNNKTDTVKDDMVIDAEYVCIEALDDKTTEDFLGSKY